MMNRLTRIPRQMHLACSQPSVVELEVNTDCNRRCDYCPNSRQGRPIRGATMDPELFLVIVNQLSHLHFSGRLSFHLYNEPLLRADLEKLIQVARQHLPRAYLVLYTNGDLLSRARYASLIESGVDYFLVTRHGEAPVSNRANQLNQMPEDLDVSGRAGVVAQPSTPLTRACFAPMEMLIVTVNGAVILCHEDARREEVLGDLNHVSILEIWNSEKLRSIRHALMQGCRRLASPVCSRCDHSAYPGPNMTM